MKKNQPKKTAKIQGKKASTTVVIGDKDMIIFNYLTSGCATFMELLSHLKKSYRPKENVNHEQILRQRLFQLLNAGYIESQIYQVRGDTAKQALYVLGEPARHILSKSGQHPEKIRGFLPNKFTVTHELAVTAIARAIKKESEKSHYDYQLRDEVTLKKLSGGSNKGEFYPDLAVKLVLNISGEQINKVLAIEYDNDTMQIGDIVKKAEGMRGNIVFICATSKRMDELRSGIINSRADGLLGRVFFGLLEDICSMGLLGANFITAKSQKMRIV